MQYFMVEKQDTQADAKRTRWGLPRHELNTVHIIIRTKFAQEHFQLMLHTYDKLNEQCTLSTYMRAR